MLRNASLDLKQWQSLSSASLSCLLVVQVAYKQIISFKENRVTSFLSGRESKVCVHCHELAQEDFHNFLEYSLQKQIITVTDSGQKRLGEYELTKCVFT